VHTGHIDSAQDELNELKRISNIPAKGKDMYKANQVDIQIKSAEAWILLAEGENDKAAGRMNLGADMEDATEKSPVTPGEVIPARELLGDMLIQMGDYTKALEAYREDLKTHPKRFNGLYGAGLAAERSGDTGIAKSYYRQLSDMCSAHSPRHELAAARLFLNNR